jgi:hypothetical protein
MAVPCSRPEKVCLGLPECKYPFRQCLDDLGARAWVREGFAHVNSYVFSYKWITAFEIIASKIIQLRPLLILLAAGAPIRSLRCK